MQGSLYILKTPKKNWASFDPRQICQEYFCKKLSDYKHSNFRKNNFYFKTRVICLLLLHLSILLALLLALSLSRSFLLATKQSSSIMAARITTKGTATRESTRGTKMACWEMCKKTRHMERKNQWSAKPNLNKTCVETCVGRCNKHFWLDEVLTLKINLRRWLSIAC